jgi:hypothetical protein
MAGTAIDIRKKMVRDAVRTLNGNLLVDIDQLLISRKVFLETGNRRVWVGIPGGAGSA